MIGLFPDYELGRKKVLLDRPRCDLCRLDKDCRTPRMDQAGKGRLPVLVVGEAPGETEDRKGRPFVGKAGSFLRDAFAECDTDLDDCTLFNAASCRPPQNKLPPEAVAHCRPRVINLIKELRPSCVILLGYYSALSVVGWLWKEDIGSINRWAGWASPNRQYNTWLCPTYHPSYVMRLGNDDKKRSEYQATRAVWLRHLKQALSLTERPYHAPPLEPLTEVDALFDAEQALDRVEKMISRGRPISFDYETTRVKPDGGGSVYCCGVSDGDESFAFPFSGAGVEAVRLLAVSGVPLVSHNLKFEARWTWHAFRKDPEARRAIQSWYGPDSPHWDTMLAAHALDSRPQTKGLKFQAFARLGAASYDDEMKPYLQAPGPNDENRVRQAPLSKVLRYCAADCLLTWELMQAQKKDLGVK